MMFSEIFIILTIWLITFRADYCRKLGWDWSPFQEMKSVPKEKSDDPINQKNFLYYPLPNSHLKNADKIIL